MSEHCKEQNQHNFFPFGLSTIVWHTTCMVLPVPLFKNIKIFFLDLYQYCCPLIYAVGLPEPNNVVLSLFRCRRWPTSSHLLSVHYPTFFPNYPVSVEGIWAKTYTCTNSLLWVAACQLHTHILSHAHSHSQHRTVIHFTMLWHYRLISNKLQGTTRLEESNNRGLLTVMRWSVQCKL